MRTCFWVSLFSKGTDHCEFQRLQFYLEGIVVNEGKESSRTSFSF